MIMRDYFDYILTNMNHTVFYTGVTNNLYQRVKDHGVGKGGKFTARYQIRKLVYYEVFEMVEDAIAREKQIKAGSRQKKIDLVNEMNPDWLDLFEDMFF